MNRNVKSLSREERHPKWTAGLDYFRYRSKDFADTDPMIDRLREIQEQDMSRASSLKPWKFQGYRGWQTDSVRWGQRGGRVLWESSGTMAACTLDRMVLSSGVALRIDLQITLQLCTPRPTLGSLLLSSATPTSPSSQTPRTLRGVHTETSGLWLGTVGRRTAPRYIRVYDKGVEQRAALPGLLWRVEVEAKQTEAQALWQQNRARLNDPTFCASYCASSLKSSGCSWPFGAIGNESVSVRRELELPPTPTRLASWLCTSVRPVIPRLLTVFTVGEVLTMLGLSDVAGPTGKDDA